MAENPDGAGQAARYGNETNRFLAWKKLWIIQRPPAPPAAVTFDLDDDERAALVALLRRTLDQARYPLAPRWGPLRAILAKLDPPAPAAELPPPIRSGLTPRVGRGRRRR